MNITYYMTDDSKKLNKAIEAVNLFKSYTLGKVVTPVLRGLSFTINQGEVISIIGPSGSGKSTLLNLLAGLDKPTSGELTVCGENLLAIKDRMLASFRQKTVGIIFQSYNLLPHYTAGQNVMMAAILAGQNEKEAKERNQELLSRVNLEDKFKNKPTELSGGEQQRVAIVRALVNKPRLILADEPTGNLDTKTGAEVIKLLRQLALEEKSTLLIVTHDERMAAASDRVLHLLDGNLTERGNI
jgi:ABC-type lipoprotein export system ATPase subunit